jgi:hypothetical protein
MESCSVAVSKCEKALRGTALLFAELVLPAEVAPRLEFAAEVLGVSTLGGGANVLAEAVNNTEVVNAFDPAEVEPFPVVLAGAPLVPAAAFAWIYNLFNLLGSC